MGYHVAAFPEELVAFFVESYTDEGETILDPFLGSGTTLKVAATMGRRGIGFEVHENFRDLIEARIQEPWAPPEWTKVDILHSATRETGAQGPRRSQFRKANPTDLFDE